MPFKECSIVSQREEFCRLASQPGANVRALCRRFGIGSEAAYRWMNRYRAEGRAGLEDRSRRPLSSPLRTPEAVEARVLAVRAEHPTWGGRKIERVLQNRGLASPSPATITEILRRHGVLNGPKAGQVRDTIRFEHPEPNLLWQMDFKGWGEMLVGRCHPLTVLDDHSRYALEIGACADEQSQTVQARLTAVFRRFGMPWRILCDNGPPWGATGQGEHTKLSVWLMDLGVGVTHGRPYHPQTQGKDERFHRTLKAEVLAGRTFRSLDEAQANFDAWREVYNTIRPHEGIAMQVPADRYRMSNRPMPETIAPAEYEPQTDVRSVDQTGHFSFKGRVFRGPKAFAGKRIALRATNQDGLFDLCYRRHVLGQVDLTQNIVKPVRHVSEQTFALSPV